MQILSLVSSINTLEEKKRTELIELCGLIWTLYSQYGEQLAHKDVLSVIASQNAEVATLIELINSSIWLSHITKLNKLLKWWLEGVSVEYHSTNKELLDKLTILSQGPLQPHWNEEIWIKIKSSDGKMYERTLDKDISKLVR